MFSIIVSGSHARRGVTRHRLITILLAAGAVLLAARTARAQVLCEDFDPQCQTDGVCQADGTCKGTPKSDTTPCDDGDPCTTGDHCQSGECKGGGNAPGTTACDDFNDCTTGDHCDGAGKCVGGGTKNNGDPCTFPGLGKCLISASCQVVPMFGLAFCQPDIVQCADQCHVCDPNTGQCTIDPCSFNPCANGCNPANGQCIAANEGNACNDFNVCTNNDQCHNGECVGTAGGTPQPTATPSAQTPTPTSAPSECVGDCNGVGMVTVDGIVILVNIALGNSGSCPNGVPPGVVVDVSVIIQAVNNALNGCPQVENTPTPLPTITSAPPTNTRVPATPTATPNALTPTATRGPATATPNSGGTPSIGTRASGTVESTTSAFLAIPNLVSAILGHLSFAGFGTAATTIGPFPFTCTSGGGTLTCNQDIVIGIPPFTPPTYTVTLNGCQVPGTSGTLTFNGTLTIADQQAESCGTIPTNATVTAQNLTIQMPNGTTATFTGFSAGVGLSCNSGSCGCFADTVNFIPVGAITVAGNGTSTQIAFGDGSSVSLSVSTFAAQCVPTIYDLEIDGNVTLNTDGHAFAATYGAYTVHDDASSGHDMVEVSGDVNSPCFGDTVTFSTVTDIALGSPCPTAGAVDAFANTSGNTDVITYSGSGVHIDFGAGGSADFSSCLDPRLFACPAS